MALPAVPNQTGQTKMLIGILLKASNKTKAIQRAYDWANYIGANENVFEFYRNSENDVKPIREDLPTDYYNLLQLMINRGIRTPGSGERLITQLPKDFIHFAASGPRVFTPYSKVIESEETNEEIKLRITELMRLREERQLCLDALDFRGQYRWLISDSALSLSKAEGWQLAQNLCFSGEKTFKDHIQSMRDYLKDRDNDQVLQERQWWKRQFPNGIGVFKGATRYLWHQDNGVDSIQELDEIKIVLGNQGWIVPFEMQKFPGVSGHAVKRPSR